MRLFEPEDRPLYYKRSATAWRNKCLILTCEQEGFLCRIVDFMWDVGACIPDTNDGAIMLRMNVLKFRKLVTELVATGHIEKRQGYIVNSRAWREIEEWNEMRTKRARVAVEREFEKRQRQAKKARESTRQEQPESEQPGGNLGVTSGQLDPNYPSTHGVVPRLGSSCHEVASEKHNEINGSGPDKPDSLHIERERKEKEKEKEEEKNPSHTVSQALAERVGVSDEGREDVSARLDEVEVGHGVFVNGETIRHEAFAISLPGVHLGTVASGLTAAEVRDRCCAHALQWAAEIENGARPEKVLPSKISNFLCRSIMGEIQQNAVHSVRKQRAAEPFRGSGPGGGPPGVVETRSERLARLAEEIATREVDR